MKKTNCPKCAGNAKICSPFRQAIWDRFVSLCLGIKPFRCLECGFHFRAFRPDFKSFLPVIPFISHCCPKCRQMNFRRSHRYTAWEKNFSFSGLRPFRCSSCNCRFLLFDLGPAGPVLLMASIVFFALLLGPMIIPGLFAPRVERTVPVLEQTGPEFKKTNTVEHAGDRPAPAVLAHKTPVAETPDLPPEPLPATSETTESAPPVKAADKKIDLEVSPGHIREINEFLESWKTAWQNSAGNEEGMAAYIFHYSENFQTNGLTKKAWHADKLQRNRNKQWIKIDLTEISINALTADNRVEVNLVQRYMSPNYADRTRKKLVLTLERTGWKIIEEKSL